MNVSGAINRARVSPSSLADGVYDAILDAIISGRFPAGDELSEVALAAEIGVSRTPVHEALKRLAGDGLIEHMTNRRARVVRLSQRQVREVFEMRLLLEPPAAERAATRLTPAQVQSLRDVMDVIGSTTNRPDWPDRAIEFDIQLHDTLAQACDHDMLCAAIARYRRLVRATCRLTGSLENVRKAFEEHTRILEALEARNPALVRRLMHEHIESRMQCGLNAIACYD